MTAQQSARLNMYNAVIRQLSAESIAVSSVPALKRAYDQWVAKVAAINALIPGQGETSTGESLTKEQAKSNLTAVVKDLADQVYAWASETHNAIAQEKASLPASTLSRMKDSVLPNVSEDIYNYAVNNKAALADYGVTNETLEEVAEAIDDFTDAAALPRNKISARKTSGKNMDSLFAEAGKLMNEQIKKLMVSLKKKYPDVYTTFINNSQVISVPSASVKTKAASQARSTKPPSPPTSSANAPS